MPKGITKAPRSRTESQLELGNLESRVGRGRRCLSAGRHLGGVRRRRRSRGWPRAMARRAVPGMACRLGIGRLASWRARGDMMTLGQRICGWRGFARGTNPRLRALVQNDLAVLDAMGGKFDEACEQGNPVTHPFVTVLRIHSFAARSFGAKPRLLVISNTQKASARHSANGGCLTSLLTPFVNS